MPDRCCQKRCVAVPESLIFLLQEGLCLHLCMDVESWYNLVWQWQWCFTAPGIHNSVLNNKFEKGYMGIWGGETSLALFSRPCDHVIWLLKWLKWMCGWGSIALPLTRKLLFKWRVVRPAWNGGSEDSHEKPSCWSAELERLWVTRVYLLSIDRKWRSSHQT